MTSAPDPTTSAPDAPQASPSPSHSPGPAVHLVQNSIGLPEAILFTLAFMAPAMSILFTTPAVAGLIGAQIPIIYLIAMVGVLCTGNSLAKFTRQNPSSGSFINFISRAFGGRVGLVSACVLIPGYLLAASTVIDIFGSWTHDIILRNFEADVPFELLCLAGAVAFTWVAMRGLDLSTRSAAIFFTFEVAVLLVIAVVILAKGGDSGQTLEPFNPTTMTTGGLGAAIVLAVYGFIGYEAAAPLGEETRDPRRNVGRAIILSTVLLGALMVFASYVAVVGFGVEHVDELAADSGPFDTLTYRYMGNFRWLIDIAGVTSTIACAIALLNVQPRLLYNVARAGFAPQTLTRIHPRWKTPYAAILLFGVVIGSIPIVLGLLGMDPIDIFTIVSTYAGLPIVIIYGVVNVALVVDWYRRGRRESAWGYAVVPLFGLLTWGLTVYYTLKPGQTGALAWTWLAFAIPFVAGLIFVAMTRNRDHEHMAAVFGGEAATDEVD